MRNRGTGMIADSRITEKPDVLLAAKILESFQISRIYALLDPVELVVRIILSKHATVI